MKTSSPESFATHGMDKAEHQALRSAVRAFVEAKMPRTSASAWDKSNHFPRDVFKELAKLNILGLAVPSELGGAGRDIVALMIVIEELSRRSLAVSVPYIMASCYAGMNLVECGSAEQRHNLLPRVATGDLLFAYGWTEPDVGADLASAKTRVHRDGNDVVINGSKRFCSGAGISDYIYTLARSGDENDRYHNLAMVLVPPSTPGVEITEISALGMKGASTTDVSFTDVRVPASHIMGGDAGWNQGWSMIVGAGLDVEKLEVAALAIGVASGALEDTWQQVHAVAIRQQTTIDQTTTHQLADMQAQLHAARLMLYDAAAMANRHEKCSVQTSMTKLFAAEVAKEISLTCQTIQGIEGYAEDSDISRYVRDALLAPIMGGSSAIQRNNIFKWTSANL